MKLHCALHTQKVPGPTVTSPPSVPRPPGPGGGTHMPVQGPGLYLIVAQVAQLYELCTFTDGETEAPRVIKERLFSRSGSCYRK